jgi:hypothetical protein
MVVSNDYRCVVTAAMIQTPTKYVNRWYKLGYVEVGRVIFVSGLVWVYMEKRRLM